MKVGDTVRNIKTGNVGEFLFIYPCGKFGRIKVMSKDFVSFERVRLTDLRQENKNGKSPS